MALTSLSGSAKRPLLQPLTSLTGSARASLAPSTLGLSSPFGNHAMASLIPPQAQMSIPQLQQTPAPDAPQVAAPFAPPPNTPAPLAPTDNPALPPQLTPSTPQLPDNFGFNDLAKFEDQTNANYTKNLQDTLAKRRSDLASSLQSQGQGLFDQANPGILDDLNSRGVFSSPTAVANAQSNALKQIALSNQSTLNDFDNNATNSILGANQDALQNTLNLRQSQLESQMGQSQTAQEEQLARDLAKQQSRNALTGSLINAGTSILGPAVGSKLIGGIGNLFGSNPTSTTADGFGYSQDPGSFTPDGLGANGTPPAAPAGAGLSGFAVPALAAGGVYGYQQLSDAGKDIIAPLVNPVKTVKTIGNVVSHPADAVKSIGKSISGAFCFDANTPVTMNDSSVKPIKDINLGEYTKGGQVLRISICMCEDGDLYQYFGTTVTGTHAVMENGCWIRVGDSPYAIPLRGASIVYSLVTDRHKVWINGNCFADEFETDEYEYLNPDESLEEMNKRDGYVRVN